MKAKGRKGGKKAAVAKKAPTKTDVETNSNSIQVQERKNRRKVITRHVGPTADRQRRSTAFYGLFATSNEPPASPDDENEVRKIVNQIMEEMLEKVEKAAVVLDEVSL